MLLVTLPMTSHGNGWGIEESLKVVGEVNPTCRGPMGWATTSRVGLAQEVLHKEVSGVVVDLPLIGFAGEDVAFIGVQVVVHFAALFA